MSGSKQFSFGRLSNISSVIIRQMSKTVIFDFDGTLADTLSLITDIFNEIAPSYDLPRLENSDLKELRDYNAIDLARKFNLTPLKLAKIVKEVQSEMSKNPELIEPFPGIGKLLSDLSSEKIRVGIVTSNSVENAQAFLSRNNIGSVEFVYSGKSLFGKGKVLTNLIKKMKLDKNSIVYVGDEVRDIEASRQAGVSVIAVKWGFNSLERLKAAKPDAIADSPRNLFSKILKL